MCARSTCSKRTLFLRALGAPERGGEVYSIGQSSGAVKAVIRSSLIFMTRAASDCMMGSAYATKLAAINPERRLHFMSSELLFTHSIALDSSLLFLSWADQGSPN